MAFQPIYAIKDRHGRGTLLPYKQGIDDGSTLSLDFTTGVLDPRLTFTRSTDATFINSSGLVQWANANIVRRSEDCTNWGGAQNITPTADAAIAPNGTQTADQLNLSATSYRYQQTAANKVIGGQRYTGSVYVRAVSGTVQVNLRIANIADGNNGVAVTQTVGETWTRLQGSFTLASNGTLIDIGLDQRTGIPNAGPGVAANVYVWGLQLQPGGTAGEYLQTTTTENYNTPRFDYDPTSIGTPRGLLIEGASTNLLQQSADWTVSPWSKPAQITWDGTTYATAPDGTNTAKQVTVTAGSSASVAQGIANATNRTVSLWLRAGSLTTFSVGAFDSTGGTTWGNNGDSTCSIISGPGSVTQQVGGLWSITGLSTTQWTRVQVFRSSSYGALLVYPGGTGTVTGTGFMWGMQMEAGNGASSYIPTGANQGSRAADICYIPDGDHSWFTSKNNCVLFMQCEIPRTSNFGNLMYLGQWSGGEYSYGHQVYAFAANAVSAQTKINAATNTDQGLFANQSVPINLKIAMCPNSDAARLARAWNGTASETTGLTPTASRFPAWTQQARFGIGTNAISLGSSTACNIYVRTVKFFPFAMSNAQLQSLTT